MAARSSLPLTRGRSVILALNFDPWFVWKCTKALFAGNVDSAWYWVYYRYNLNVKWVLCRQKSCRGCLVYCSVVCRRLLVCWHYCYQRPDIGHCRRQSTTSNAGILASRRLNRSQRTSITGRKWLPWINMNSTMRCKHNEFGDETRGHRLIV